MAHDDNFVCLPDDDGLKHIDSLLKPQIHSKRHGNTWIRRFRREKPSVVESCVLELGTDQTGQYLDIEPDLRHAPLIISESGCNANTKTVSTPREKLQDKLVLDGRRSPILNGEDATRYRTACMGLFIFGPRHIGSCRNRETFGSENERAS